MSSKCTFLVHLPNGSVEEFCESKSHIRLDRPKKRNIDFEIYVRKVQSSIYYPSYPLNTQIASYSNIHQNFLLQAPQNPPPPIFQNTSNASIPLTQNSYPPNIQASSSPDVQPEIDLSPDDQPEIESEIYFDTHFDDVDPDSNFEFN